MLHAFPPVLRGLLASLALVANTLVIAASLVVPSLVKLVLPVQRIRRFCDRLLNKLASGWVAGNTFWMRAVSPKAWNVEGVEGLNPKGWYLVSSNHQSWVDILVLQRVFFGRIPFLKFFLKQQLIWVPIMGLAWWALDFPFLKRGKGHGARSSDLAATRKSCERFKLTPTSVISFVEGTRITAAKHKAQSSPYRHLLKPRVGGLGVALATMGEQFEAMLDVTIVYPLGIPTFWDLLCGRVEDVIVRVAKRDIPVAVIGDPAADANARRHMTQWIEQQWLLKDTLIDELLPRPTPAR